MKPERPEPQPQPTERERAEADRRRGHTGRGFLKIIKRGWR